MTKTARHKELLEDEWYHVRHSGEIPEVALHSSLHYLSDDESGPGITLDNDDVALLHDAALERYREIILRDILPENRDSTMYRGILRSIANWRRMKRFAQRHNLSVHRLKEELPDLVLHFLEQEIKDVRQGLRQSSINCSFEDLSSYALELGFSLDSIELELRPLCLDF